MKKCLFYVTCMLILLASGFIYHVSSLQKEMYTSVEQMVKHKVQLELNKMVKFTKDSTSVNTNNSKKNKLKYVVYLDSVVCSKCEMTKLSGANTIVDKINSCHKDTLDFVFIFDPGDTDSALFAENYNLSSLALPVYLDTAHTFIASNTFIPKESKYHSFLLDTNGSILLLGNPVSNDKIESMLYNILNINQP